MTQRNINIIIAAAAISVILLIAIQIYWITNVIKVENERFDNNANNAIQWVVNRLEKDETALKVLEKVSAFPNENVMFIDRNKDIDSIVFLKPQGDTTRTITRFVEQNGAVDMKIEIQTSDTLVYNNSAYSYSFNGVSGSGTYIIEHDNKTLRTKILAEKSKLVEEVVDELIAIEDPVTSTERIKTLPFDSLLVQSFEQNGISATFEYAVIDGKGDSVIKNSNSFIYEDVHDQYKAQLFPDNIFGNINYLHVDFPDRSIYIAKSVSLLLILSILLIGVISYLFYKTVKMLLAQKKISEVKNDLINNITHEFKTPISTIALACEALNEPALNVDETSTKKYGGIIKQENNRLRNMVEQILTTAAMENGINNFEREILDINNILTELAGSFYEKVSEAEGELVLSLNIEKQINGNPIHIYNIFHNLLDNAVKYATPKPEVHLSSEEDEGRVIITVSDNGPGISKKEIKRIFEPFYRISTGNIHDVKGHGLGLNYVKKMVTAHNGKIEVNSKAGRGTTFTIFLPEAK